MPTYQYACTACSERLEAVQSFTDAPLTECPACGGALRKVFSAVGVVFKGSGFYKTDSRKAAPSGADKADKGDKGDKGGDSKSGDAGTSTTSGDAKSGTSTSSDSGSKAAPAAAKPATTSTPAGKTA